MNHEINIPYFWAKTEPDGSLGISVHDHSLNVGCVAEALLGAPENTSAADGPAFASRALAVWLAACHDIGKISPGFLQKSEVWVKTHCLATQIQTKAWTSAEKDHSAVSQFSLQYILRDKCGLGENDAAFWAAAAGMHHGEPHWRGDWKRIAPGIEPNDIWESYRQKLAEDLGKLFGEPEDPPHLQLDDLSPLWWTAGLITLADWIGSDEYFFSPLRNDTTVNLTKTRETARNAISQIGMEPPAFAGGRSFYELFGFPPNDLQVAALEIIREPGVYVIEAPMGMGKTEAALAAAYQLISNGHARGLYFALPTQATSNRIHERVGKYLNRIGTVAPRLIHSGSWLVDKDIHLPTIHDTERSARQPAARDWFASAKRALLAPFGVGTVDQALLGVIAVKHFFLRHYALAGKVVVLDEVHSYDVYTGTLIEALIRALAQLRCTVIILSATLTCERREKLLRMAMPEPQNYPVAQNLCEEPFPLITGVAGHQRLQPRPISPPPPKPPVAIRFRAESSILPDAVSAARSGACVLWICDTVDRAMATYLKLMSERSEGGPLVGLLHSRFPFFRRQDLENDWMVKFGKDRSKRPPGCILVSTQIVEQSVDLDADLLITELAPTDMLFQRLGRLWRHHKDGDPPRPLARPEVWIIEEDAHIDTLCIAQDAAIKQTLGKKAKVYAPYALLRALEQWHDKLHVNLPSDIRPWLEATYQPRPEHDRPGWKALLLELKNKQKKFTGRADTAQNVWNLPSLQDEEGTRTRLNECPTVPLILAKSADERAVILLEGQTIPTQSVRFDYATAKTLHRNIVKAPAWWFGVKSRFLKSVPSAVSKMVSLHIHGTVEIAVIEGTTISTESLGDGRALDYTAECGLSLNTAHTVPTKWKEEDDESYD